MREANGFFKQLLESDHETLTICEEKPRVLLRFAPALPPKLAMPETLDVLRADDRLIHEVLHFRAADPSAQILTGDTGMRLRARRHQVPVFAITDTWLRPPGSDERDKEIQSLKAKLARLEDAEPKLELIATSAEHTPISSLSAVVPSFPVLSADEIACLVSEVQSRYPKVADFGLTPPRSALSPSLETALATVHKWHAPTNEQINEYRRAYDEWIEKARERFERLSHLLDVSARILTLHLELRNTGARPADEVLFKITSHAGLKFCISENGEMPKAIGRLGKLARTVILKPPPEAPKGEFISSALARFAGYDDAFGIRIRDALMPPMPVLHTPAFNRDRHAFYRQSDDSGPTMTCSFSRAEFRHRADPQLFRVWVLIPPEIAPSQSHLHCRVSARNLAKPLHKRIPITLSYESRSTREAASQWRVEQSS